MNKESIIELQKIDCNCNDCISMVRDFDRFQQSLSDHKRWQLSHFNTIKAKKIERSKELRTVGKIDEASRLVDEANKMRFRFDKSVATINYGNCTKLNKKVSFIPNTVQLDTQECFIHRKENK